MVTYLATFNKSTTLPAAFTDKSYWYPISPATKESTYDPLPALGDAQWAALRQKQTVTDDPVGYVFHLVLSTFLMFCEYGAGGEGGGFEAYCRLGQSHPCCHESLSVLTRLWNAKPIGIGSIQPRVSVYYFVPTEYVMSAVH